MVILNLYVHSYFVIVLAYRMPSQVWLLINRHIFCLVGFHVYTSQNKIYINSARIYTDHVSTVTWWKLLGFRYVHSLSVDLLHTPLTVHQSETNTKPILIRLQPGFQFISRLLYYGLYSSYYIPYYTFSPFKMILYLLKMLWRIYKNHL